MTLTPERIKEIQERTGIAPGGAQAVQQSIQDRVSRRQQLAREYDEKKANPPNLYERTADKIGEFGEGVVKGGLETLQNVGSLVTKPLEKVTGDKYGFEPEAFDATTPAQKVGKFTERVAEAIVPASKISTATKGLSFLPRVASRVAGDVVITGAQTADVGQSAGAGAMSTALQVAPLPVRFAKNILKNLAGFVSGRGTDVIEQIIKDPDLAVKGIKGDPTQLLKRETNAVIESTKSIATQASKNYEDALKNVEDNYEQVLSGFSVKPKDGMNLITKKAGTAIIKDPQGNKFNLSISGLKSFLAKTAKEYGAEGSTKTGLSFENASLLPNEQAILNKVVDKVNSWTDLTPTGINRLRQAVTGYAREGNASMQKVNGILYGLGSKIGDYLGERVPEIAEMNARYATEQRFLQELRANLSLLGKVDKDGNIDPTEFKNVASKLATLFNKDKGLAREVLEKLPGGEEIVGMEAGRQLASDVPLSKAAIGGDISALIQSIIPPSWVGLVTAYATKAGERARPLLEMLEKVEPEKRTIILQSVREMFE